MMMKRLNNEKGVALVIALVVALIGLGMVSTLLFLVTQSTRISGFQKTFRTTDEAGLGGAQIATQFIQDNIFYAKSGQPMVSNLSDYLSVAITNGNSDACLIQKLTLSRGEWDTGSADYLWTSCSGDRALTIDADKTPDFKFDTNPTDPAVPNFRVYAKIIDTVKGNTQEGGLGDGKLGGTGVVSSQEGEITPPPNPSLYRIEIQAQDASNPEQRSKYSVLYAH